MEKKRINIFKQMKSVPYMRRISDNKNILTFMKRMR